MISWMTGHRIRKKSPLTHSLPLFSHSIVICILQAIPRLLLVQENHWHFFVDTSHAQCVSEIPVRLFVYSVMKMSDAPSLFIFLSTCWYRLVCHYNLHGIANELVDRTERRINTVSATSISLCSKSEMIVQKELKQGGKWSGSIQSSLCERLFHQVSALERKCTFI